MHAYTAHADLNLSSRTENHSTSAAAEEKRGKARENRDSERNESVHMVKNMPLRATDKI